MKRGCVMEDKTAAMESYEAAKVNEELLLEKVRQAMTYHNQLFAQMKAESGGKLTEQQEKILDGATTRLHLLVDHLTKAREETAARAKIVQGAEGAEQQEDEKEEALAEEEEEQAAHSGDGKETTDEKPSGKLPPQRPKKPSSWQNLKGAMGSIGGVASKGKAFYAKHFDPLVPPWFVILVMAVHFLYFLPYQFNKNWVWLILYLVIWFLAAVVVFKTRLQDIQQTGVFFALSMAAWLVPLLADMVKKLLATRWQLPWLDTIIFLLPVWVLYLAFHPGSDHKTKVFTTVYLSILLLIAIITLAGNTSLADKIPEGSTLSPWQGLQDMWGGVKDGSKKIIIGLFKAPMYIRNAINKTKAEINNTLFPSQMEDKDIGVFIDKFEPADRLFYPESDVLLLGTIRGKSFTKNISITTSCSLANKEGGKLTVRGEPEVLHLGLQSVDYVQCNLGKLPSGTYPVKLHASFDFETWADTKLVFMDGTTLRTLKSQNKDVNAEFGIPSTSQAIYTNGPVAIGIISRDLPIGVMQGKRELGILGVSLQNQWQGEFVQANQYIIRVLKPLELARCDRVVTPALCAEACDAEEYPSYNSYLFDRSMGTIGRQEFKSITCYLENGNPEPELHPTEPALVDALNPVRVVTVVVEAKYRYSLEKEATVTVGKG